MSYDIYLRAAVKRCPACGVVTPEPELPDPTYNLTPIFDLALTWEDPPNYEGRPNGLRVLSGRKAEETADQIALALHRLQDPANEAKFRALEPPNKWGDLEGAREVMARLLSAANEYPHHIWEIR